MTNQKDDVAYEITKAHLKRVVRKVFIYLHEKHFTPCTDKKTTEKQRKK